MNDKTSYDYEELKEMIETIRDDDRLIHRGWSSGERIAIGQAFEDLILLLKFKRDRT